MKRGPLTSAAICSLLCVAFSMASPVALGQSTTPQPFITQDRFLPPAQLVADRTPPPPRASEGYPEGLLERNSPLGRIYANADGRTVYAMHAGYGLAQSQPENFCVGRCAEAWRALAAPADAEPAGAWRVVEGANGRQWAYGPYPVFTYAGDHAPGDLNGHEYADKFFAINVVPRAPVLNAPSNVGALLVNYEYRLADAQGRLLYGFANSNACARHCENLDPFIAGMTARNVGDWRVSQRGGRAQWTYRGRLVYVARSNDIANIVAPDAVLRP